MLLTRATARSVADILAVRARRHARGAQGEKWQSEFERSRKFSVEQKKKNLTDHGFKYSSPNKKSSGLGNYYGAIGPKHRHEGEHEGAGKGEKPPLVVPEPRQMMTMPPKKGRFNTPGISFGAPQPRGMPHVLGKEFEYKCAPRPRPRRRCATRSAEARRALDQPRASVSSPSYGARRAPSHSRRARAAQVRPVQFGAQARNGDASKVEEAAAAAAVPCDGALAGLL